MGSISPTQEAGSLAGGAAFVGGGGGAGAGGGGSSVEDQLAELMQSMGHGQGPLTQEALNALLSEHTTTAHHVVEPLGTLKQQQGMQAECGAGLVMPAAHQPPYSPCHHPLYRTASAPSGANRGLLRTSSLNSKKSAPNRVCCNALLAAYARASPTQVYHVMTMRGIEPTVATFGTLVCIAADAQATAHVKCAWQWLCASGLEVHITCANAYLQALLRELFNKQLECGVQPSGSTMTMLINAFSAKGLWKDALGLLTAMCRPESCSRPALGTFVTVFQALRDQAFCVTDAAGRSELGRIMGAVRLLLKSQPQTHPDPALFSSMISAFEAVEQPDVCVELFNNLLACGLPIDCDVAESTLAAVVKQHAWGRAVQLVRAMLEYQSHNPPLGAGMCAGVLLAMANHQEWAHAYEVIKALYAATRSAHSPSRLAGSNNRGQNASIMSSLLGVSMQGSEEHPEEGGASCLSDLVDVLQAEKHTDLLLLVVIAEKEVSQHWGDAVATFRWVMQQGSSVLASSRLGHTLFYELLFLHAGVEGLRESVHLCKTAHEMGVLCSFPLPRQTQLQKAGGSAGRLDQMSGAGSSETFQAGMSLRGLGTGKARAWPALILQSALPLHLHEGLTLQPHLPNVAQQPPCHCMPCASCWAQASVTSLTARLRSWREA
ncbi:hypothetical protein DUNSADRAFT_7040 [Dunaliella salina]|uniref:Pentatricopeptide repeat-containing protein n=1 Tax=Dunaliella salina TaxID=3046 RepID=A0ABQ7H6F8_DUNSA|nr:hypothetical protein DUNSADRAFT_7040 [Dunaliella salina]|eukprot:KAF5842431.1 hypothetical protein DUNSADRAFT_7040 [Dunaliella salina]